MTFPLPNRFPRDKDNWVYEDQFSNPYYTISNYYRSYPRRLTSLSSSSNMQETVINPITDIAMYMLHQECIRKTNKQVVVRYQSYRIDGALPNTLPVAPYENDPKPRLNIYHVRMGSPRIPELDKTCELKNVSMALQRSNQHRIRVFKRNENLYEIYTNVWAWEIYYKIIAMLPMFFPQVYIEPSEEIMQTLIAMADCDSEKFNRIVGHWMEVNDPEKEQMVAQMRQFFTGRKARQITSITDNIANQRATVQRKYDEITNLYRELDALNLKLLGLERTANDAEQIQDTIDYITKNKSIKSYQIAGESIYLTIETPLKYVDVDAIKHQYIVNKRYDDIMTQFLQDTFVDEKYEIMATSVMILNLDGATVERGSIMNGSNVLPQPHIMGHNCWGNNKSNIKKALEQQDLIQAVAQCIATNMNLNAVDGIVVRGMISHLIGDMRSRTCIRDTETDQRISYLQYIDRYNKERG